MVHGICILSKTMSSYVCRHKNSSSRKVLCLEHRHHVLCCVSEMFFQVSWPPIVEYCRWGVRRSAGVVVRSAVHIQWDELKQTYSSKEFVLRMPPSACNLPAVPAATVPKPAGADIVRIREEG